MLVKYLAYEAKKFQSIWLTILDYTEVVNGFCAEGLFMQKQRYLLS